MTAMRHFLLLMITLGLVACGDEKASDSSDTPPARDGASASNPNNEDPKSVSDVLANGEAKHIRVQHCLISFTGAEGFRADKEKIWKPATIKRNKARSEQLAQKILSDCEGGWDLTKYVNMYSEDRINPADAIPGTYYLCNDGVTPDQSKGEMPRSNMVKAFGDAAFGIKEVGGHALVAYGDEGSPYGWHVIKRIE